MHYAQRKAHLFLELHTMTICMKLNVAHGIHTAVKFLSYVWSAMANEVALAV